MAAAGVLLVSAVYPSPETATSAAGVRARAIARGLRDTGRQVTVVCASPGGGRRRSDDGVEVVAAPWLDVESRARRAGIELGAVATARQPGAPARPGIAREIVSRVTVPDRYVIWVPGAVATAARAGRRHDVVVSTGPVSAHLVARTIRGRRPWLADCNDFWARNPHRTNGPVRDAVDTALERVTLAGTTRLTAVNDEIRDELHRRHGKPATTLRSGFDPADFPPPRRDRGDRPVELLFAGTLYPDHDLGGLLGALARGRAAGLLRAGEFRVTFLGRLAGRAGIEAEQHGVGELVTTGEPIPRAALLQRMADADALLLLVHENEPNALPMRFFEYVGAGRPILLLGGPGHLVAQHVSEHRLGRVVADPAQLDAILPALAERRGGLPEPDDAGREAFTWGATMATLATLVDTL
jgi:glycosyl transferase family 4